jgi:drug/metabolite transporter (DMT)-like permease
MSDSLSAKTQRRIMLALTAALVAWALFHAYGAVLGPQVTDGDQVLHPNPNPWRGVVVLACMGGFLAFWWAMLATRKKREKLDNGAA